MPARGSWFVVAMLISRCGPCADDTVAAVRARAVVDLQCPAARVRVEDTPRVAATSDPTHARPALHAIYLARGCRRRAYYYDANGR